MRFAIKLPSTPKSSPDDSITFARCATFAFLCSTVHRHGNRADNGLQHARVSERQLNTAAKTGLPGMVKPATYRSFAEFCMDVYDALCRRGWRRLQTRPQPDLPEPAATPFERMLVESYPHAAWKSLQLKPLRAKRQARVSDLAEAYASLRAVVPFTTNRPPNHDQLQAIVGGLPGLALEEHNPAGVRIVGNPPHREQGHWREGFIVLPLPPRTPSSLRWLHQGQCECECSWSVISVRGPLTSTLITVS